MEVEHAEGPLSERIAAAAWPEKQGSPRCLRDDLGHFRRTTYRVHGLRSPIPAQRHLHGAQVDLESGDRAAVEIRRRRPG